MKETFENIYLDLSKQSGKCRLAEHGLGWRPSGGGETFTLDHTSMSGAQWSRAARGYELKIYSRQGVVQLDGFREDDMDRVSKCLKVWYGLNLEPKEHALRGWNWGKAEFGTDELAFSVHNKPAFEIPYSEISNTNLAGKTELAVEFFLPANEEQEANGNGNGHGPDHGQAVTGGAKVRRGRKAGGPGDQLVEMRFYIPGTTKPKEVEDEEGAEAEVDDEQEELNAATAFYNILMDKAEIGDVAGDTFATFLDVLHLTPRGRFNIDMYESSFRLRGKTYDYKIQYDSIKKFMLLPKPDDTHMLITVGLDPPLRQGQTRYPFLVMQFKRDEEITIEMNMTEELLKEKYAGKVQAQYNAPIHAVVAQIFRGLAGKRVTLPSKDFVSHHQQSGVKCSVKANEGLLFCLDKSFMFVPKPATYISMDNVSSITMSRVGGAVSASRTFDITITLKGGAGEHQFSNINREEQRPLESFFRIKNLRTKNEMVDDSSALLAAALKQDGIDSDDDDDDGDGDDDVVGPRADRGSADEDEESVDDDFHASSESDVAEEYDSAHESADDSADEDGEADGGHESDDGEGAGGGGGGSGSDGGSDGDGASDRGRVNVNTATAKPKPKPKPKPKLAASTTKAKTTAAAPAKKGGAEAAMVERPKKRTKTNAPE
ncbi:MAG: FACT complex subunit [Phylliscum demangeonii]|nr:MAG: FACT complex subunit [Phylliscum demangeonii]